VRAWVPALRRTAEEALHRIRDTRLYDLKKLFAASFEARFLVAAACKRSISDVSSEMRSLSSSTESSERSCPISWLTFRLGLSSSSNDYVSKAPKNRDRACTVVIDYR